MSTIYNGNPDNVVAFNFRTITNIAPSAGVGSDLLVTVSTAHGYSEGDYIKITGVTSTLSPDPNTTLGNEWRAHIVSSTTFTLVSSPYVSGTYTSGGTADDVSLGPPGTFPSDGESGTAEDMLALIGLVYDRSQYVWRQVYVVGHEYINGVYGGTYTPSAPIIVGGSYGMQIPNAGTWTILAGGLLQNNGTIGIGATGAILATSAGVGWLLTNGEGISINDNTNPTFVTPRTADIAQPLLLDAADSDFSGTLHFDNITDGWTSGPAQTAYIHLTQMSNGATLTTISVFVSCSSPHTAGVPAVITLYKTNNHTGAQSTVGSANVTALQLASSGVAALGSLTEVIDTSKYTYVVEYTSETSTAAQHITWYAPIVHFTNITSLGQAQG